MHEVSQMHAYGTYYTYLEKQFDRAEVAHLARHVQGGVALERF